MATRFFFAVSKTLLWPRQGHVVVTSQSSRKFRDLQKRLRSQHFHRPRKHKRVALLHCVSFQMESSINQHWGTKIKSHPLPCNRLSQPPSCHSSQGHPSSQAAAHASCAKTVQMRTCYVHKQNLHRSKSFALLREEFSNVDHQKEVPKKTTIQRPVTIFQNRRSVCLWQVFIERENSSNYGHAYVKPCVSSNSRTWLQQWNAVVGFDVLCRKLFTCRSQGYV
jgi:hypothetical protein